MRCLPIFSRLFALLTAATLLLPGTSNAEPAVLEADDLTMLGSIGWVATGLEMPPTDPSLPIIDPDDTTPEARLLRRLENSGEASGFGGVLYDNRDRGHSAPPPGMFPRLTRLRFGEKLRKRNLDFGLAGQIVMPAIVIGNSSTAINRPKIGRSQPRLAMTTERGGIWAFLSYVSNHLYVYPEHKDHDKTDLFPVNWPYMVISQGSSHSDKPFLRALFMTLAALPTDTRDFLREQKLVAPTLQMILRRSQKGIYSREAYQTGRAHPVVFNKHDLAPERMVSLAASLKPGGIPPMVQLKVLKEDFSEKAGLAMMPEQLINSPSSIARIWRGPERTKRMVLSSADTTDPNDRDLEFSWVLLQGDPRHVRIMPQGPNGARAEIDIDWHDTFYETGAKTRKTNRVDIGVFAWNGIHDSAPAIISISFPGHQKRIYKTRPDGNGLQSLSIDYDADSRKSYYDPTLHWSAPWVDTIQYDSDGKPLKWLRKIKDETVLLRSQDGLVDGRAISYTLKDTKKGRTLIMQVAPK